MVVELVDILEMVAVAVHQMQLEIIIMLVEAVVMVRGLTGVVVV